MLMPTCAYPRSWSLRSIEEQVDELDSNASETLAEVEVKSIRMRRWSVCARRRMYMRFRRSSNRDGRKFRCG